MYVYNWSRPTVLEDAGSVINDNITELRERRVEEELSFQELLDEQNWEGFSGRRDMYIYRYRYICMYITSLFIYAVM